MASAIRFDNLTLGYDRHPAVHHLTGTIPHGALLAIVGPNGAGKSTLMKAMAGFIRPLGGRLERNVKDRRDLAYLPQVVEIDRSFPISVYEFVSMGAWNAVGLFGGIDRPTRLRIEHALSAVGLEGFESRAIGTLSGGQMQRTLFARLLMQDASMILLDEPFNAIDQKTTEDLVVLIRRWHSEGRTVIAVLHDLPLVRAVFPETLLLARETIAWGPTLVSLTQTNLDAAQRMVEAFDADAHICERA
ncbi:MAG TPA: ABC transporter ATP-binding protein [Beijerinckiaceae bacterium]|nr:ABC transporter ATP-binding protein [Beijerinckiaceae bacterium]